MIQFSSVESQENCIKTGDISVSIIVCIKNEAINLQKNVLSWIKNLHGEDELIIVDDYSEDNSYEFASQFKSGVVQIIKSTKDTPGKKQALIDGINQAKNPFILLTDADCSPSPEWKESMTSYIGEKSDFILGYAPFGKTPGFLNTFQRFECMLTAFQYISYARAGIPYMGVGRNLLFRKSTFDPNIYSNEKIASGDDDLLVSAKANKSNTEVCLDPVSFVYSEPKKTRKDYIKQKLRHTQSSVEYSLKIKFFLALFAFSTAFSLVLALFLLFASSYWLYAVIVLIIKWGLMYITLSIAETKLLEKGLKYKVILLDIALVIYYLTLSILAPFYNKRAWM